MRKIILGLTAVAAMAAATAPMQIQAQTSSWAYFEGEGGLMQAGVQGAGGEQLILKCDETGSGEVFAVIFTPSRLKPPSSRPQPRDVSMRYDGGSPQTDSWLYYEQTALALNTRRERQLPQFLRDLADVNEVEVTLDPVDGSPIRITFNVTGTRDAVARVFESCGDDSNPLAAE